MHVSPIAGLATLILATSLAAAPEELELRTTGYFMWDIGFVDETQDTEGKTWDNEFIGGLLGGLRLTANPSERLYLIINPEFQGTYMLPRVPGTELGIALVNGRVTSVMDTGQRGSELLVCDVECEAVAFSGMKVVGFGFYPRRANGIALGD